MSRSVKNYTKEFRQEAVQLALKSPTIHQAANNLGIPPGTLYSWIEQAKKSNHTSQNIKENDARIDVAKLIEENRRLHKELLIAKEEKEILKKAAAYFAQHQK